jgi:hypothetical protein
MAADRIRTTISLDPQVHAIFVTMAEASGTSVSRCMGDWLADTAEGAQFVASKMLEARRAPKTVMREMQAMSRGLVAEIDEQVQAIRQKSLAASRAPQAELRRAGGRQAPAAVKPPCSPTGVKSPGKGKSQGRKAA